MTVIDRPWLFRDDDGRPRDRTSWLGDGLSAEPRWRGPIAKKAFEPHDEETRALIRRLDELAALPHGQRVAERIEQWQMHERMSTAAEKQIFLEPIIQRFKRAPERNEADGIFLLLVCEPVRRGAARRLSNARSGLDGNAPAPDAHRREEALRIGHIERERLYDVTRDAVLYALFHYPSPPPRHFFGWLRETVAFRAIDFLRDELADVEAQWEKPAEAEALFSFISGLEGFEPDAQEGPGFRRWKSRVRHLFEPAEQFMQYRLVREACSTAVDRLPRRQRQVIEELFMRETSRAETATKLHLAPSTVSKHRGAALARLEQDDVFFMALVSLDQVRDYGRVQQLNRECPNGVLPDGRRLVHIDQQVA